MMTTLLTESICSVNIQEALDNLEWVAEPDWKVKQHVKGNVVHMVLFSSEEPKFKNKVRFHAFSCGLLKVGFWDLETAYFVDEIQQRVFELISEFQVDTLAQKKMYVKECADVHEDTYGFYQ
jgi:hypothetical protein